MSFSKVLISKMVTDIHDPITVDQMEAIARQKLPSNVYNYYSCGADDQTAVKRNRDDFDE